MCGEGESAGTENFVIGLVLGFMLGATATMLALSWEVL